MNYSRIQNVIDVPSMQRACVAIVGTGGSAGLACNLARSGVGRMMFFDPDIVTAPNIARQQHDTTDIGRPKTEALADSLRRINSNLQISTFTGNFLDMDAAALDTHITQCNLLIFATDRFAVQAAGNSLTLRYNVPALFVGLYAGGLGGEIIFWHPGIEACFGCLCRKRYEAHQKAEQESRSLDPASDGTTIFDVTFVDAIAGMIAVGLLTSGSDNRFGRLIKSLGQRNFIQVQIDPAWAVGGVNPVRKYLGVDEDCPAFFAWNTIVRQDPQVLPCPDCERFRGHSFVREGNGWVRIKPTASKQDQN